MTRALVIGGTQFIGRELVRQLLEQGSHVVIMHRSEGTPFGSSVDEIRCDRNDVAAVRDALADTRFDLVFDNVYDWEQGTTGEQVAAAARTAGTDLRAYVFTSSVAAYGGGMDHDEEDALAPPDHPDAYVRNKADSERALFRLHAVEGLPAVTLRPAFVYGPHNPFDREAFFWDRIVAGRPIIVPGDGSRLMQWAMAADVARAAILAAESGRRGVAWNLGNEPPLTQVEFIHALARAAASTAEVVHVPRERITAAGGGLFAPPLYFGTYLDLPSLTMRAGRMRAELGLEPTPLEDGLRATFAWYRQQDRPVPDFTWEDALLEA